MKRILRFIPPVVTIAAGLPLYSAPQAASLLSSTTSKAILDQYCVRCHNDKLRTGSLTLENQDLNRIPEHGEKWEKVILKLRLGMMPPQGLPRPDETSVRGVVQFLESTLDRAAVANPRPGGPLVHRLNRAEYANSIRDLLGFDVDVTALLPPDNSTYGFDNVADALGTSPALLQAYLAAARKVAMVAVGDARSGAGGVTYSVRQDLSQDTHIEGLPLGTVGGTTFRHVFSADGYYDFQLRLYRTNLNTTRGLEERHQVELTLDGERVLLSAIGGSADLAALQKNTTDVSDAIEAQRLKARVFVRAGERDVGAAFIEEVPARFATRRLQSFVRDFNTYDAEGAPHIKSITIQGPFETTGAAKPAGRIFLCRPANPKDELPCARRILSALARRAYRRDLSPGDINELISFYEKGRAGADFETGIEFALRRTLSAPSFIFRAEAEPDNVARGSVYQLGNFDIASRLSFFLWSSIPDDELLNAASQGKLHRADVLNQQVRRMLADPRARALVENFAGQWLQLRNLTGIVPDPELNPDFDDNLRRAFRQEAQLFFGSIIQQDRSVVDLLSADYTFVDQRLAKHYGIPDVFGSQFRRVHLNDETRQGLLGKGAVLMVTSHSNSTSPVLRGKWVLENLLGYPVPPPPPDVPALKEAEAGSVPPTMRERMEQHRADPVCASCHKIMDPIGFALENFNEVGAWRTTNEGGVPLNTAVDLADGTAVGGVNELRKSLLKQPENFVQTLTQKLMVYALGRGLTYEDMPTVREIVRSSRDQNYRFSSIVLALVKSPAFQSRAKTTDQALAQK
jgi:hypothetical protein